MIVLVNRRCLSFSSMIDPALLARLLAVLAGARVWIAGGVTDMRCGMRSMRRRFSTASAIVRRKSPCSCSVSSSDRNMMVLVIGENVWPGVEASKLYLTPTSRCLPVGFLISQLMATRQSASGSSSDAVRRRSRGASEHLPAAEWDTMMLSCILAAVRRRSDMQERSGSEGRTRAAQSVGPENRDTDAPGAQHSERLQAGQVSKWPQCGTRWLRLHQTQEQSPHHSGIIPLGRT